MEEDLNTISDDRDMEKDKQQPETPEELIYDKGYAWIIVLACFLINFCTWGMNSGFAIYFSVYSNDDVFHGATKLDYAAIGGLALGATQLVTPVTNYLQGKLGTRTIIIIGNIFQFTALMLASWSTKLWQLYLTQGLMQSVGLAFISIPSFTIIPQFFKSKRVLAGGISTAGSGVGGIVFNLSMQKIVKIQNTHWALRAQAIISFGLVWIAIVLIRTRSHIHKIQFTFYDSQILKCYIFYVVALYAVTCMFGYVVILYTLDNFTTTLGYTAYQGSIASAMIQVGSALGRAPVGLLADRYGPSTIACGSYILSSIFTLAMLIPARNYATVIAFGVIMGAIMGTIYGSMAPILAKLFGMKKISVAFSKIWIFIGMAGIVSPVIGVSLVKPGGGPTQYVYCSVFAGASFFVCACCLLFIRGYILARDRLNTTISVDAVDYDHHELGQITVPFSEVLKSCLQWGIS